MDEYKVRSITNIDKGPKTVSLQLGSNMGTYVGSGVFKANSGVDTEIDFDFFMESEQLTKTTSFNSKNNYFSSTDSTGAVTYFDDKGNILQKVDRHGNVIENYVYDENGNCKCYYNEDGIAKIRTYKNGKVMNVVDEAGNVLEQAFYSSQGFCEGYTKKTTITDSNGMPKNVQIYTTYTFDKNGLRTDTVYNVDGWDVNPQIALNNNEGIKKLSATHYNGANILVNTIDYTTNRTIYYVGDQKSSVVDANGREVERYNYTPNGILSDICYLDGNGNVIGKDIFNQYGEYSGSVGTIPNRSNANNVPNSNNIANENKVANFTV